MVFSVPGIQIMWLLVDTTDSGWWYGLAWRETCWNRGSSGSLICCKERLNSA